MALDQNKMDVEIVGLFSNTNGRSCTLHGCCGSHVGKDDILRLVYTVVEVNGVPERAVKCVRVLDGVDTCTVGFIPRIQANLPKVNDHINQFVQVTELYCDSPSSYKQSKSAMNCGMASAVLLSTSDGRNE